MLKNITHLVEYVTGIDTRVGLPGEHLGKGLTETVNTPIHATGIGLVVNADQTTDGAAGENKVSEKEESRKKSKVGFSGQFFDKFKSWLKDDIEDFE